MLHFQPRGREWHDILETVSGGGALWTACLLAVPAQAGYVVTLQEVGSDVVATGSGPIDLTGLILFGNGFTGGGFMEPAQGIIVTGLTSGIADVYTGITGPASFGPSFSTVVADSGSGDFVGIQKPNAWLFVPSGYLSESPLSDSSTYLNETFGTIGVTPGTYEWTWGPGANQNFTLVISEPVGVPEPTDTLMLETELAGLLLAAGIMRRIRPTVS